MPTAIKQGIDIYTGGDFLDEVAVTLNTELLKRRGTNGNFTKGKSFNPTNELSIKGGGSSGLAVGLTTIASSLAGGVKYITKDEHTQKNSDFDDFTTSAEHLPNASDQT